jgi:predicted PurR-regulated permease PerM
VNSPLQADTPLEANSVQKFELDLDERDVRRWRSFARVALTLAVFGFAAFVLQNYLRALVWALVLAIALWPLYQRLRSRVSGRMRSEALPALFALAVALVFMAPLAVVAVEAARESHALVDYAKQADQNGIPVPDVVSRLPDALAKPMANWWESNLAHEGFAKDWAQRFDTASNRELGRTVGRNLVHRLVLFAFAFLTLFFLFKDGEALRDQCRAASKRVLGLQGERIGRQAIASIHGTVNGLVLVGIGEGVLLGIVYALVGVPHAVLLGAFTAVAAMIPFAAAIAFGLAALLALGAGKTVGAIVIVAAGFLTTFTADHVFRPALIGGATKLPFLWVLLGILAGVETFGLLGLFIGPAAMAVAILLWREIAVADGARRPEGEG